MHSLGKDNQLRPSKRDWKLKQEAKVMDLAGLKTSRLPAENITF